MDFGNLRWLGWLATAMTVFSYFCRDQIVLRRVQAVSALVWMSYGIAISARPIIAANVIVAAVAAWSTFRGPGRALTAPATPGPSADG